MAKQNEIFSAFVTKGRLETFLIALLVTLFGLYGVYYGFQMFQRADLFEEDIPATVIASNCVPQNDQYLCEFQVQYRMNGRLFSSSFTTLARGPVDIGQVIRIKYNPTGPGSSRLDHLLHSRSLGMTIMAICLMILGFAWLSVFLAIRYPLVAAADGLSGLFTKFAKEVFKNR